MKTVLKAIILMRDHESQYLRIYIHDMLRWSRAINWSKSVSSNGNCAGGSDSLHLVVKKCSGLEISLYIIHTYIHVYKAMYVNVCVGSYNHLQTIKSHEHLSERCYLKYIYILVYLTSSRVMINSCD